MKKRELKEKEKEMGAASGELDTAPTAAPKSCGGAAAVVPPARAIP